MARGSISGSPLPLFLREIRLAPRRNLQQAAEQVRSYLPVLRQLSKELEKYPNAKLVDVTDNTDHVCAAMVNGKLRIDANEMRKPWSTSPFPPKTSATSSIA